MASPIKTVTPCTSAGVATGAAVTTLPTPSRYGWGKEETGEEIETESGRIVIVDGGARRPLVVEWVHQTLVNGAAIIAAFSSKYVTVEYLDAGTGTWISKNFIVRGPIEAPLMRGETGHWETISFNLMQQDGVV